MVHLLSICLHLRYSRSFNHLKRKKFKYFVLYFEFLQALVNQLLYLLVIALPLLCLS